MRAPYFWSAGLDPYSRQSAPLLRFLLTPFAGLYAWGTARKIARTKPVKVEAPVICIGNLTSGGSGKTPITQALQALLTEAGARPVTLSRGYGGALKGPVQVDANKHGADQVGDEPLLLAASGEAWIGRDKVATAQAITATGNCVILMDDGHQNPTLHKDLSFVVIDAGAPFGNGYVIPKGPLREAIKTGLARADCVVLINDGETPAEVIESGLPVMRARLEQMTALPDGPLLAFAGIGRPERFFDALRRAGGEICDSVAFADHHKFSQNELKRLHAFSEVHGARLVTTEKDYLRLPEAARGGITPIKVRAVFEDTERLLAILSPHISRGQS